MNPRDPFWHKVAIGLEDECWPWRGTFCPRGYGRFGRRAAHRFAYEAWNGAIPHGLMIRHLCGNKSCQNPAHLAVGTHADNAADGDRLGEITRGSKNGRAKITEDDAREIIASKGNVPLLQLSARYGLSKGAICLIQQGKRWAHVHRSGAPA